MPSLPPEHERLYSRIYTVVRQIPPGKVATHVATADDTVDYYCRLHPNMKGRITVEG